MNNETYLEERLYDCKGAENCIRTKSKEILFDYKTYQWAALEMSPDLIDLLERDADIRWCIQLINNFHNSTGFTPYQGQLWTIDLHEQRLSCVRLIDPDDHTEPPFGTKVAIDVKYDPHPKHAMPQCESRLFCYLLLVVYQGHLCFEHELERTHPLRKFVHLEFGE